MIVWQRCKTVFQPLSLPSQQLIDRRSLVTVKDDTKKHLKSRDSHPSASAVRWIRCSSDEPFRPRNFYASHFALAPSTPSVIKRAKQNSIPQKAFWNTPIQSISAPFEFPWFTHLVVKIIQKAESHNNGQIDSPAVASWRLFFMGCQITSFEDAHIRCSISSRHFPRARETAAIEKSFYFFLFCPSQHLQAREKVYII